MHHPTRKFVRINELCSHFHFQKRKRKEEEEKGVRKSRMSIFAFRKEDSSFSSSRGGKVKWNALYGGIFRKLLTRKEERYQEAGVHDLSSPRATTRRFLESLRFGNRPRLGTQRHFKRADIRNDYVRRKIMPRAENLRRTIQAFFHGIFHRADFFEKTNNFSSLPMISKFLFLFISLINYKLWVWYNVLKRI